MTNLLLINTVYAEQTGVAVGTSNTEVPLGDVKDYRVVFRIVNSDTGAVAVTFDGTKEGVFDAFKGSTLTVSAPAGVSYVFLDMGYFKVISGVDKNKVFVKAGAASKITIYPISLPNA